MQHKLFVQCTFLAICIDTQYHCCFYIRSAQKIWQKLHYIPGFSYDIDTTVLPLANEWMNPTERECREEEEKKLVCWCARLYRKLLLHLLLLNEPICSDTHKLNNLRVEKEWEKKRIKKQKTKNMILTHSLSFVFFLV